MSNIFASLKRRQKTTASAGWLPLIGLPVTLLLLTIGMAYAGHCPPGGIADCEDATTTAKNPLVPLAGGLGGALAGAALRGRRPKGEQGREGPGTQAWEPGVGLGGPDDNPYTYFDGGQGPGQCGLGLPNYWINTATLGLVVQDMVFVCRGLGPGIKVQMSYNSGLDKTGMFGASWRFSYESTIHQTADTVLLWRGSGQGLRYRLDSSASSKKSDTTREAVSLDGKSDRLLDYGRYWLFVEKTTRLTYRYDKASEVGVSRLTSISDLNGNSVTLSYNENGSIGAITDAAGRAVRFSYDGQKRCTAFVVPNGRTAKFGYDGQGNLAQAVDLQGVITEYQYDADPCLTRMIVGGSRKTTTFSYGASAQGNRIVGVTDAAGNTTRYEMASVNPRQVRVIDAEGRITSYDSTTEGLTQKITDPMGNAVEFGYAKGLRVSVQNKNGHLTRMDYDGRGNLTKTTDPAGSSWSLAYDANDNLIASTNPLGEPTRYAYAERHQLIDLTSPIGRTSTFSYDAKGQLDAMTDPKGHKTGFEYDGFGNLTAIVSPLGDATRISYDTHGLTMTSMTDARGNSTQYEFDGNNRLTKVSHPDGATRTHIYDCCAGIATIDENGNKTEFIRSPLLYVEQLVDRMGDPTRYDYDRSGRLVAALDALNRRWSLTYDKAGRVIEVKRPAGQALRMNYDAQGNLLILEDERGKQTHFTYDGCDLLTELRDPLRQVNGITRDNLRRIQTWVNARGAKISFAYDGDGRISSESYDGVAAVSFAYDASDNLTTVRDSTGEAVYQYDAADRVTSIRYRAGLELAISSDAAGNINAITYPGGLVVTYSYDTRNRVTRVVWGKDSITFRYDAVGNLIGESRSNRTESNYRYNANQQLTEITHQSGNNKIAEITYSRDAVGNITAESAVLPLTPELTVMTTSATYNDANQIVNRGPDSYTYDADGNLIGISGDKWHAVYDAVNRPVEIRRNGQTTYYTYDGMGQRRKTVRGSSATNYYYDRAGRLMFETDEGGRIKVYYVYCGAALVARVRPTQTTDFYHFDKTGNTLALTGTDGRISAAYAYSPFGAVVKKSGHADDNPFTYVGEYGVMDEGDGLFFMKNRYYDAHTGRFVQKDPIGFIGGTNLYAYVGNNTINHIDPEGLQDPITIGFTLLLAGAAAYFVGKDLLPFKPINETLAARAENPAAPVPQMPSPAETVHSLAKVPETLALGAGPAIVETVAIRSICPAPGVSRVFETGRGHSVGFHLGKSPPMPKLPLHGAIHGAEALSVGVESLAVGRHIDEIKHSLAGETGH